MNTGEALVAAILANSEDDTPRLVFADWLEENDNPEWAEFIRLQVWLARQHEYHGDHEACVVAFRREKELAKQLIVPLWEGEQPEDAPSLGVEYDRGFPHAIICTSADWMRWSANIIACNPIRQVTLTTEPEWNCTRDKVEYAFQGNGMYWLEGEDEPHLFTGRELDAAMRPIEDISLTLLRLRWPGIEFTRMDLTRMDSDDMMTRR